jgi:hypothetical protein
MDHATQLSFARFIGNIAGDLWQALCVRGKYRDVILPDCVRLSCLDPS